MLIDFVGEHHHLRILLQHIHQPLELIARIDRTRGVGRRAEKHHASARSDGRAKLIGSDFEILLNRGGHGDSHTLGELHHFNIADPGGSGNHHLIAGIDHTQNHIAESLLRTTRNHNLLRSEINTVGSLEVGCDSLAQAHEAGHG